MARPTFFLRGSVTASNSGEQRAEAEIDLGAFVNLGSSKPDVLRIHSIQTQVCDSGGLPPSVDAAAANNAINAFLATAITTKASVLSADDMPQLDEDSTIYSSSYIVTNLKTAVDQGIVSGDLDLAPQNLMNGILVGVDTLYLYALADNAFAENVTVNVCMECSIEPMSKENAVNLALSQA